MPISGYMKLQHKELFNLLKDKNKLIEEGRKISVKIESLETQRNKLALQVQKIKDKVIPIVKGIVDGQLGEFEEISEVRALPVINEVEIETYDQVEQFKEYLTEKKNASTQSDTESSPDSSEGDQATEPVSLDS